MTVARASQPRPRFTDLTTLFAAIVGGSASSHRSWPLYCPGVAGGDDVEVGRWERFGAIAQPVGPVRLNHLVFRSTVLTGVADPTHATATAGHGFVTGDTVRFWDTSAGAEIGDRVVTVAGNALSWVGNIAALAIGDQAFAVADSPLTIGDATRQIYLSTNALCSAAAGSGLVLTQSANNQTSACRMTLFSTARAITGIKCSSAWTMAGSTGAFAGVFSSTGRMACGGTELAAGNLPILVTGPWGAPTVSWGTAVLTKANIIGGCMQCAPAAGAGVQRRHWYGWADDQADGRDYGLRLSTDAATVCENVLGANFRSWGNAGNQSTITATAWSCLWD